MSWFDNPFAKLDRILQLQRLMMASLDDLKTKMTQLRTLAEGNRALIAGLREQIADLNLNLSTEEQEKVDAIFADAEAASAELTAAQTANTPAEGVEA